jgi:membrane dipeptidase
MMTETKQAEDVSRRHAMALHHNSMVVDMHCDAHLDVIRSRGKGENRVLERRHLPLWRSGGVDAVVLNTIPKFGPDPYPYRTSPVRNFLLMLDAIQQEIAETPRHFLLALEPDDILRARREGKIGLILGLEGAEAIETDLGLLRCYYRLGLRVMNLTWHQRNLVADGVSEPSGAGLSNFGRAVVEELNRLGIIIDVSHLSPAGVDDVLERSEVPIMASHSNAKALCDHQRNLDDDRIARISEHGGMVGVVFLGRFVAHANPTLEDVLEHTDHILHVAGAGQIGIGPDYVDFAHDMIIAARSVAGPNQPVNEEKIPYAEGLEDVSKLANFTTGLVRRGYEDKTIQGILGENFINLWRKIRR